MLSPAQPSPEAADSARGWRVVAGVHVLMGLTFGSAYTFSALFPGLAAEFNASRGEVALVFSISAFVFYGLGAMAGPIADRWSTRPVILAGLIAMIAGYAGASQAGSLAALYAWYGAGVGLGIGLSYVPAVGAVQSWFERRRSQASGIATAGLGVGTLLLPLAIGHAVTAYGWRWCFIVLAIVVAVLGLPAALLVRKRHDGAAAAREEATDTPPVWRDGVFRMFYLVLLLASFCVFIAYVHIVPAARDLGLSLETGTLLVGLIGVGNIVGRFVLSGFGDRIGRLRLLVLLTFAVAGALLLWALATGIVTLALFAVLFGMSYGGCVGLYPAVAADLFGTRRIGTVLGYLYTAVGIAALLGPPVSGFIFDRTGSYTAPILASAAAAAVAGILTLRLRRA